METALPDAQAQLVERRRRVEDLIARGGPARQLEDFLSQIDEALDRFAAGTYGLCDACHEPIEAVRLRADPVIRLCLAHLTPSESLALERDLELASRVQATLLPPRQMTAGGWQIVYQYAPLATVSGDYVDVIRPDGGDGSPLLFLFGDIAGKGVAASMLMAHLHASMRTLVDLGFPLAQMMARANRVFCESTMLDHYATLVCGRLDSTGGLELLNPGHCPPLLLHEGSATPLEATGLPVGLFCVEDFTSRPSGARRGGKTTSRSWRLGGRRNRRGGASRRRDRTRLLRSAPSPGRLPDVTVRLAGRLVGPLERLEFGCDLGSNLLHLVLAPVHGGLVDQAGDALEGQRKTDTGAYSHQPVAVARRSSIWEPIVPVGHGQVLVVPGGVGAPSPRRLADDHELRAGAERHLPAVDG